MSDDFADQEIDPENPKKEFKGVWIPKEIWEHSELNITEKVLWTQINLLDGKQGCYASNSYFSKFLNCEIRHVTRMIRKLIDLNLIELFSFNGRTRVLVTKVMSSLARQKCLACIDKNVYPDESHINYNINNNLNSEDCAQSAPPTLARTSKIPSLARTTKRFIPPTVDEVKAYCDKIGSNIDPELFVAHYSARGWLYGKGVPMKDWKSAVVTWKKREKGNGNNGKGTYFQRAKPTNYLAAQEGEYDGFDAEVERQQEERYRKIEEELANDRGKPAH